MNTDDLVEFLQIMKRIRFVEDESVSVQIHSDGSCALFVEPGGGGEAIISSSSIEELIVELGSQSV